MRSTTLLGLGASFAALALSAPAALAQHVNHLDAMHDAAFAIASQGSLVDLERALWMHAEVVHQRGIDDERRFECLRSHANLLYSLGHRDAALAYLEEAAAQAANEGDDFDSAMTYLDAVTLAEEVGNRKAMLELARRADALLDSPRLDRRERALITARLAPPF